LLSATMAGPGCERGCRRQQLGSSCHSFQERNLF